MLHLKVVVLIAVSVVKSFGVRRLGAALIPGGLTPGEISHQGRERIESGNAFDVDADANGTQQTIVIVLASGCDNHRGSHCFVCVVAFVGLLFERVKDFDAKQYVSLNRLVLRIKERMVGVDVLNYLVIVIRQFDVLFRLFSGFSRFG